MKIIRIKRYLGAYREFESLESALDYINTLVNEFDRGSITIDWE